MSKSAIKYYLRSVPTLLNNFNWWLFPSIFFKRPVLVRIKNNPSFYVSSLMDIWTLKEVVVDRGYEKNKKVGNGDFIVDIGAAIGSFSISTAVKATKIIAWECDNERVSLMKKNLQLNRVTNVELKHAKAKSLKQIMNGVDRCDFFKIDCEGGEYDIFRGVGKADLDKIQYIAMEAHKFDKKMENEYLSLLNVLQKNNFSIRVVPDPVHRYTCLVFAHKNS